MFCSLSLSLPPPSLFGWVTSRTRSAEWGLEEDSKCDTPAHTVPSPGEKKVNVSLSSHQAQNLGDTSPVLQKTCSPTSCVIGHLGKKLWVLHLPQFASWKEKAHLSFCSLPPWMFLFGWQYYCVSSEGDGRIKTQLFFTFIIFLQRISSQISSFLLSSLGGVVVTHPVLLSFRQSYKDVSRLSLGCLVASQALSSSLCLQGKFLDNK